MDYFVLEQTAFIALNAVKTGETKNAVLYKTSEISKLLKIDYIYKGSLVSDRLKQLFERYLPQNKWIMNGYVDIESGIQEVFWQMDLFEYIQLKDAVFRNDGIVKKLSLSEDFPPVIFKVKSPRGVISDIVHISVAESLLRRKYYGLKLTRL
ncbi:MAG: hypothetical protein FWH57_04240 [Oscillospiraceae bacterium]|nr:hypothetical protein [Oscillospiraceae bacterium]